MAEVAAGAATVKKDPNWKIRIGKAIFYTTVSLGLGFFYWFAAIQCPC